MASSDDSLLIMASSCPNKSLMHKCECSSEQGLGIAIELECTVKCVQQMIT